MPPLSHRSQGGIFPLCLFAFQYAVSANHAQHARAASFQIMPADRAVLQPLQQRLMLILPARYRTTLRKD